MLQKYNILLTIQKYDIVLVAKFVDIFTYSFEY